MRLMIKFLMARYNCNNDILSFKGLEYFSQAYYGNLKPCIHVISRDIIY